ncbi:MAG: hypothetical protein A4E35_02363 [Methanoregula sp. PtaU1.Bin051]|nr:MAG: hypothetical protein A4E35_02363 [Methanoregula sp. PtaU1.Bin051]
MRRLRIPPIFGDLVLTTFSACDGLVFDRPRSCPACGGPATGYDRKNRHFAVLAEPDASTVINVVVKRFRCMVCGKVFSAEAPFYPNTRIGSPIVDLCKTFGQIMPSSRVSANLAFLGITVDRWTVRNYVLNNRHRTVTTTELYGIEFPLSLVSLIALVASAGGNDPMDSQKVLEACGFKSPGV